MFDRNIKYYSDSIPVSNIDEAGISYSGIDIDKVDVGTYHNLQYSGIDIVKEGTLCSFRYQNNTRHLVQINESTSV